MADEGLPGLAALDSPYGLAPQRPSQAAAPEVPRFLRPVLPLRPQQAQRPQRGIMGARQGAAPPQGGIQNRPTEIPHRVGVDSGNVVVGRDIPIERFVAIHKAKESGDNYQALNREKPGNTASGAYQYTDATWNNYGGYEKAMLAPREVQDRRYAEDLAKRLEQFNGDPFKAMAAHYLPAYASDPTRWGKPVKLRSGTVAPVATYLRQMARGTELAEPLEAYLARYGANGQ